MPVAAPAHIGAFLEPLLFLPAFLVVLWSIAGSIRNHRLSKELDENH